MTIDGLSPQRVRDLAAKLGIEIEDRHVATYAAMLQANFAVLSMVDSLPTDTPSVRYPRGRFTRPPAEENRLGAWYVRGIVTGAPSGKLAGRTVALKDTVFLAGVPMQSGTSILEGYVPEVDATIVDRILDAGATIVGKTVCEAYCFSGGSHTSATGPVRNPHDPTRSAGGSSSGSGALVAAGEVDMAIGCDQGGSIRMPASFCGIYGMKPTHGLVPYTGILGMDPTIDHVGPMTANVHDNALLLEVIAGADGVDSRQYAPRTAAYTERLDAGIAGLRIGLLQEGFGLEISDRGVDESVRSAAKRFERLGATVTEVSVPMHAAGASIGFGQLQVSADFMFHTAGVPLGRQDPLAVSYVHAQRRWRERTAELPANVKLVLLFCEFLKETHGYEYVAKTTAQVRRLRAAYDAALEAVDLLIMPTTPMTATPLPAADAPPEVVTEAAFSPTRNTMPFDCTHHPAMSIPCGTVDGLPVGMMLIGRHFDEPTIYRAAYAFEQHADWRSM